MEKKMKKVNLILQLCSMAIVVLFLTVGLSFLFHYDGPFGKADVNAYGFAADSAKKSNYLDYESAMLLENGKTESGDYVCKILISNERLNTENGSHTLGFVLCCLIGAIAVVLIADFIISITRTADVYKFSFNLPQLILKAIELTLAIAIAVIAKIYLTTIGEVVNNFNVGFGTYLMIVLGLVQIIVWSAAFVYYRKRSDITNIKFDDSIGYLGLTNNSKKRKNND